MRELPSTYLVHLLYANFPPIGDLLRRVIAHLDVVGPETQRDTVLWI